MKTVVTLGVVALAAAGAQNVAAMDVEKLLAERAEALASFKDPHRSPYAAVARLYSSQLRPAWARTRRADGSTCTPFIGWVSIITPPSVTARPAAS